MHLCHFHLVVVFKRYNNLALTFTVTVAANAYLHGIAAEKHHKGRLHNFNVIYCTFFEKGCLPYKKA